MEYLQQNVHSIIRRINPKVFEVEQKETLEKMIFEAVQDGFLREEEQCTQEWSYYQADLSTVISRKLLNFEYISDSLDKYISDYNLFSGVSESKKQVFTQHIKNQVQLDLRCKFLRWQIGAGVLQRETASPGLSPYDESVSCIVDCLSEHNPRYQLKLLYIIKNYHDKQSS